ncbi:unnamed protein product, partial [Scytosiphon promiscuus]
EIKGPVFDVLTPFTNDDALDLVAFGDYLQFLSKAGVRTILCNGEMGEFASLTTGERELLLEFARETFPGTVLNHVSAPALPDVARLISHSSSASPKPDGDAQTLADAVVVMPPHTSFGGFPDERGTEAFLRKALEGCQLPVFLYSAAGNPISLALYARLCEDFPIVSGILDGSGDNETFSRLKEASLPGRQLLVLADERRHGAGSARAGNSPSANDNDKKKNNNSRGDNKIENNRSALLALQSGADACVTGASNPLPELAVGVRACFDEGDIGGASRAQERLDAWAKRRMEMSALGDASAVPLVKAAVASRVPSLKAHTRPPHEDLDPAAATEVMRWVANNEDVVREKQTAHIKRVSVKLAEEYRRAWNSVEVAGLEMLIAQLSASEDRLLEVLDKAKRERAELNGRAVINASAGEAQAAKLLSSVIDARRQLEEDAEERGRSRINSSSSSSSGDIGSAPREAAPDAASEDDLSADAKVLWSRLEQAVAVAE